MKKIFTYLKRQQYIEAFKSIEPTVNDQYLEIYKLFYMIINNQKMINLYESSKEKFWKKMTDELVRKSLDGENLSKYIYNILIKGINFKVETIIKINYIWKKYYENKFKLYDVTMESPTTGIFLLIILEYLERCGIIESEKNDKFFICAILKNDILNIDQKISDAVKFYDKLILK